MINADGNEESSLENPLVPRSGANRYQEQREAPDLTLAWLANNLLGAILNFRKPNSKNFSDEFSSII